MNAHLPVNAVLLFDGRDWGEHQQTMYDTGRTCYRLKGLELHEAIDTIRDNGGIPYVVTSDHEIGSIVFESNKDPPALIEPRSRVTATARAVLR